jgi:hypothetical protein
LSDENLALTHDEAFELLMYLVSSAHDCLTESPNYGVTRLMFGAERLARSWGPRAEGALADYLAELAARTGEETGKRDLNPEGYKTYIAEMNRRAAQEIKRRAGEGDSG